MVIRNFSFHMIVEFNIAGKETTLWDIRKAFYDKAQNTGKN